MRAEVGNLVARIRARFTVDSKEYKGTLRNVVEPDEPGVVDSYACTCVVEYIKGGGVVRHGSVIPHCQKCLERQLGIMDAVTGAAAIAPDRTPAGTIAQLDAAPYRSIACVTCEKQGKHRTFRTAGGFADHLKNYHGAKDGDAVERLG